MRKPDIRRYSSSELEAMIARGEDRTDWTAVMAKTEEELEADIANDPDWADIPHDWINGAVAVRPGAKKLLSVRLDNEVVDWFRAQGRGYQTRMNAVLLAYVRHQRAAKKTG